MPHMFFGHSTDNNLKIGTGGVLTGLAGAALGILFYLFAAPSWPLWFWTGVGSLLISVGCWIALSQSHGAVARWISGTPEHRPNRGGNRGSFPGNK